MTDPLDRNQAEPSDISAALDVEQLDLNLYRSRSLSIPFQGRGVFGGQVISQALVSATKCVKPESTLHVSVCPLAALADTCLPHRPSPDSHYMYVSLCVPSPLLAALNRLE